MSVFRKLFGRAPSALDLDLAALVPHLQQAAPALEGRTIDPDLLRAQLADRYRDGGIAPMDPHKFEALASDLDAEAWRRLALAVAALELEPVRALLPRLLGERDAAAQVHEAFVDFARALPLLTMELLRKSPLRVEEFARAWAARLGATIRGETPEESREALRRLDYARLLADAERARQSAHERVEYLRKLAEEDDARVPRRGKW